MNIEKLREAIDTTMPKIGMLVIIDPEHLELLCAAARLVLDALIKKEREKVKEQP